MTRLLRPVLILSAVVLGLFFLTTVSYVVATASKMSHDMGPHEVPPREVKLRFHQVADQKLPKSAAHLRAIVNSGRATAILVRFETDRQGQDEVVAMFAEQGAVFRELDPSELAELNQPSSPLFSDARAWQDDLGIDLYVPAAIRSARVWDGTLKMPPPGPGHTDYDVLYQVLINPDSSVVYIFAASQWAY